MSGLHFGFGLTMQRRGGGGPTSFASWMWEDGTLNPLGYVQNFRSFSAFMWAGDYLNLGGLVVNSEAF